MTLLFGHVAVSGVDLGLIFKATYSRANSQRDIDVTSFMMTCPASRTLHCERVCTMTSGCMFFYYSPLQRTCNFYSGAARCPSDNTKQNGNKHSDLYYYRKEGSQGTRPRKWTRLLYGPVWLNGRYKICELSLHRKQIKTYPYLRNATYISSMALMPKSRKLLVSKSKPPGIWNVPLDKTGPYKLVKKVSARHMAVDEDRGLLFYIDNHSCFLRKIYLECRRLEDVIEERCYELAVFPNHQLICTCINERLMVVSYNGATNRIVGVGNVVRLAPNAAPADVLYYYTSGYLKQISLTQKATLNIKDLGEEPRGLIFDGQKKIYLILRHRATMIRASQTKVFNMTTVPGYTNSIFLHVVLLL